MFEIFDKVLLFICCTSLYLFSADISYAIIPVIIAVLLSSLFMYFDDSRFKLAGNLLFMVLCIISPLYAIFLPLLAYDIFCTKYQYGALAVIGLLILNFEYFSPFNISFTAIFLILAYLLKFKTVRLMSLQLEYNELRDSSAEFSIILEEKNRSLLKNQDYEINLAMLNERNRISKEIHDNVGHLLSRALLQVGALQTIAKDDTIKDSLTLLKNSLSGGMDQIRNSIHQMYDESIDLYTQINNLVKDFTFCHINFEYDLKTSPPLQLKYSLIAIVKESLANIIKHSNASKAAILLREHPAMYQIIIRDNGTFSADKKAEIMHSINNHHYFGGMGLKNIYDRVKGFNGNINISVDNDFQIFISIPKAAARH